MLKVKEMMAMQAEGVGAAEITNRAGIGRASVCRIFEKEKSA